MFVVVQHLNNIPIPYCEPLSSQQPRKWKWMGNKDYNKSYYGLYVEQSLISCV